MFSTSDVFELYCWLQIRQGVFTAEAPSFAEFRRVCTKLSANLGVLCASAVKAEGPTSPTGIELSFVNNPADARGSLVSAPDGSRYCGAGDLRLSTFDLRLF